MGIIIGKFKKKKSTYEILEKLEKEITSIEEFGRSTEQFRKKVIKRFILLAIVNYFVLACILYLYYNRISPNQKLMYFVPLIAFPFVMYFIKKFLAWYYSKKLQRNEKKLVRLKENKKKILNNVMETETYKVAKEILDKFGAEKKPLTVTDVPLTTNLMARSSQIGLRQRTSVAPTRLSFGATNTPGGDKRFSQPTPLMLEKGFPKPNPLGVPSRPSSALTPTRAGALVSATPVGGRPQITDIPLSLPRSILPSNRSVMDKMVDYLIGDGPSNRYALICKKCCSHNGMAHKEEFDYLSFRCCYCSHFNPARKKKPTGPKFETSQNLKITHIDDSSESDQDTIDSESDAQKTGNAGRRSSSEPDLPKSHTIETRNSSSETEKNSDMEKNSDLEKNSDFDKLSDLECKEGDVRSKLPLLDSCVLSEKNKCSSSAIETEESTIFDHETEGSPNFDYEPEESPMEIDQEKCRTDSKDNES